MALAEWREEEKNTRWGGVGEGMTEICNKHSINKTTAQKIILPK